MWMLLLSILKILGIIVLSLLGIVVIILLCVLFVPIYYKLEGAYQEKPTFHGKVSWLFPIIRVTAAYEKEFYIVVRVLGFKVYDNLKEKVRKNKKNNITKKQKINNKQNKNSDASETNKNIVTTKEDVRLSKIHNKQQDTKISNEQVNNATSNGDQQNHAQDFNEDKTWFHQLLDKLNGKYQTIKQKVITLVEKIRCQIQALYDKIKGILNNINDYYELFQKEETKIALKKAFFQIFKVLKYILPRKWNLHLELGFEDPATLGNVFAVHGMFYSIIGKHIHIIPYWDEEVLRMKGMAKGHIQIIVLIICVLKLMTDKQIRKMLRMFKKEEA